MKQYLFLLIIIKSMNQQPSTQKLLPKEESRSTQNARIRSQFNIFISLLFAFERNYESIFLEIKAQNAIKDAQIVNKIPGYRKYQLIFLYYYRKYGILKSFLVSLLFPLPFTLLFYFLGTYVQNLEISNEMQVVLIGFRCSVISYLCRYCLHFPEEKLNWFIYFGSIICALISNNNYTFVIIYILSIFFSYFKSEDVRSRSSIIQEEEQQKEQQRSLDELDIPQIKNRRWYLIAMIGFFVVCWIAQRMYVPSHHHYYLIELFIISLLNTNQDISTFFPGLYSHLTHNTNIYTANIYSLGYLLPGLHLKTFFLLLHGQDYTFLILSYLAIHLPSLLMICICLGYPKIFYSLEWRKINNTIQTVSNGLILVTVINLLNEQSCQWNITFFTSLVIFTVTKLYKFNEIISAFLGIFLVASRASVLQFTNKKSLPDFLCKTQ